MSVIFHDAAIQRAYGATGATTRQLDEILREPCVSVLDFGAVRDGTTDDRQAFLNAANYLLGRGGGYLYAPGSRMPVDGVAGPSYYLGTTSLNFQDCANATRSADIHLIGDGYADLNGTKLNGAVEAGGVLQHNYGQEILKSVRGVSITNSHARGIGCVANGSHNLIFENCKFYGAAIGLFSNNESYQMTARQCDFRGFANSGVGAWLGQNMVENSSFTGWDYGAIFQNAGAAINDCRFEVNRTGMRIGMKCDAIFTGSSSGTTLTVSNYNQMSVDVLGVGTLLIGSWGVPLGVVYITALGTGTGGNGTYTTNVATNCNGIMLAGSVSTMGGFRCSGHSFERNSVGIDVYSIGGGQISGLGMGGVIGPNRSVSSITWSSSGGGTATVTTASPHFLSGSFLVSIEGANPSGYNGLDMAATVTGASTFTYPVVSNPGGSSVEGTFSQPPQYGMRIRGAGGLSVAGVTIGVKVEKAGIDLTYDNNTNGGAVAFSGVSCQPTLVGSAVAWSTPPSNMKHAYTFSGCSRAEETLAFADLPGEAGIPSGALKGMEYWISTGAAAAMGAAVTSGTGGGTSRVAYNGTSWIRTA